MRRGILVVVALTLALTPVAHSGSRVATKQRCESHRPPSGSFADCFSGAYHGTGFMPMEETISFRIVSPVAFEKNILWREWVADAKKFKLKTPCTNQNAITYMGKFSFYSGGTLIACSNERPYRIDGYFHVNKPFFINDEETTITLTHGVFFALSSWNNVVELVFSDRFHQHFAQPEVVLGPSPIKSFRS